MPVPASLKLNAGQLAVSQKFSVSFAGRRDAVLDRGAVRFLRRLTLLTGLPVSLEVKNSTNATVQIEAREEAPAALQLGEDESYILDVNSTRAQITAPTTLGALHGLQTLLQLVQTSPDGFYIPGVHIEDAPRFPWRGLMIDVSRHFMPVDAVERNLDAMEAVKLNVFHWHLSDDQGFRIESKDFPKLQEFGSDGLYYTQEEVRSVIAYARDRGIRVVPEFDMPGHTTSWFAGYPELASAPGPYSIERGWGIFDPAMDPTRESTYRFLEKFLGEMARLFPDAYFHVGGDEVNGKQWEANPAIQAYMKAHNLKSTLDLQHEFNGHVEKILERNHKFPVGWDEILSPGLSKETLIQSWRGQESLAEAAREGYRGILSHGYYLDQMWPAEQHYAVDPLGAGAANLPPNLSTRILGGEACMWTEFVSLENLDSRIWPRTAAIAERLWSPQSTQDAASMYARLRVEDWRLALLGAEQRAELARMISRLAGPAGSPALETLAGIVEPVKGYTREHTAMHAGINLTSLDPLNRMVDSVSPESETGRAFSGDVEALIAGGFADHEAEARVRAELQAWQANDAALEPLLSDSALLKEISPVSKELSALAAAGLEALDAADRGATLSSARAKELAPLLADAQTPHADLLLMAAPAVQKLVTAVSPNHATNQK